MKKLICMLGAAVLFQMAAAQTETKKEELVHSGKDVYLKENGKSFKVNTKVSRSAEFAIRLVVSVRICNPRQSLVRIINASTP